MRGLWLCILLCCYCAPADAYWHCSWPYRTTVSVQENTGTTLTEYQVKLTITASNLNAAYNWTGNGYDLRVLDSDDNTQLDFWIESWNQTTKNAVIWVRFPSLSAAQKRDIYLYYGNLFATQLDNVPFTFTQSGIKYHTRRNTVNPNDLVTAQSLFNAANDSVAGYGCKFINNFTGINNTTQNGSDRNFIAYSETFFEVKAAEAGTWGIRYGADFGYGGGLYVDGQALEEDWLNNLWWNNSWANVDVLQGSINLSAGYHKLEVIGAEDCCDGGITVQYQKPLGSWTTYSTANIDIRSRACPKIPPSVTFGAQATASCPAALAEYRFEETYSGAAGEVKDYAGSNEGGSLLGTAGKITAGKICAGLNVPSNTSFSVIEGMRSGIDINNDVGNQGSIAFWYNANADWGSDGARTLLDATYDKSGGPDQYFQLQRLANGRLQFIFEDSADTGFTLQETSSVGRFANTWYHITLTWDFINNSFALYVDGLEQVRRTFATNGQIGELDKLMVGDNSSSTYTAGYGSSANGKFDEVWIYSYPISIYEAQNLMASSRPCSSAGLTCADTFPGAIATTAGGKVTFGYNAQALNGGNELHAGSVAVNTGSTALSCGSVNCSVDGIGVTALSLPAFPDTSVNTLDLNIGFWSTGTLGSGGNNAYRQVNVGYLGTLNTNAAITSYYIDRMTLTSYATLNLTPGDYWINQAEFNVDNLDINVVGTGVVRLFVNSNLSFGTSQRVNSPGLNSSGDVTQFVAVSYGKIAVGSNSTLSGLFYSSGNFSLASPAYLFGSVAADGKADLNSSAKITYNTNILNNANNLPGCTVPSTLASIVLSYASVVANCEATPITVSLFDNAGNLLTNYAGALSLSVSTQHGDWGLQDAAGNLTQAQVDKGAASYNVVAADGGDFILNLRNTHPESATFTISDGTVSQSGSIGFQNTALRFLTNGSVVNIPTMVAGKLNNLAPGAVNLAIEAIETDTNTGQCKNLLLDNQWVEWGYECLNPAVCNANSVQINATNIRANNSGSGPLYNNVLMDFGGNTSSQAAFTLKYADVGQIRLFARHGLLNAAGVASGEYISGSSNNFVVQPAGFCVRPGSAEINADCSSADASCSAFKAAGSDFTLEVMAVAWQQNMDTDYCDNALTSQFAGAVNLTPLLVAPAAGSNGSLSVSTATLNSGQSSFNQQISEMGVFSISAGGNNYLGTTLPNSSSANIGRFFPAYFQQGASQQGTFTSGCAGFTYTGQVDATGKGVIQYATLPNVNIVPKNQAGITLQNYIDNFVRAPTALISASSSTLGADGITPLAITADITAGTVVDILPGSFNYQLNASDHYVFTRDGNAEIAPFNNDIQLNITSLGDADGISAQGLPWLLQPSGGEIRYGRMRLGNQYGPQTSALQLPLYLEYLGNTGYQLNTSDQCFAYNSTNASLSHYTDGLLNGDTSVSGAGTINAGSAVLNLSAPLNQHLGSVRLNYDAPAWLEYDVNHDGMADDPYGIATFGRYRGHDKIIYWKELNY